MSARRPHAPALALAAALCPALAHASRMDGLAVVVAAWFVGIPALVVLAVLLIVTLVKRRRPRPSPGFVQLNTWLSIAAAAALPAAALFFEARGETLLFALVLSLPGVLLAALSILLARRLRA